MPVRKKYILTRTQVKSKRTGETVDAFTGYRILRRGPISMISFRLHGPYVSKAGRDYYVLFVRMKYNRRKRSRYGR